VLTVHLPASGAVTLDACVCGVPLCAVEVQQHSALLLLLPLTCAGEEPRSGHAGGHRGLVSTATAAAWTAVLCS
jgi:hypothetical protein